jgi:biotin carboxylase
MRHPPKLLLVELGGPFKAFLLDRLAARGAEISLATGGAEPWAEGRLPRANVISTDPYNSIRLLADVTAHCEREGVMFDGVGTFWEHTVTQTADLAAALGFPGIPPGAARRSSANKLLMRRRCREAGIAVPPFKVLRGLDELEGALAGFPTPAVVKPVFGDDSFGVMKLESAVGVAAAVAECRRTWSRERRAFENFPDLWLLEQYLPGAMASVDGIVQDGRLQLAGVVEIGMGPEPRFTQSANWLPSRLSPAQVEGCLSMTRRVVTALGFDQCGFHCELRVPRQGDPALVEIAARLPGGLIPEAYHRAYGIDLANAMLDLWTGVPAELRADRCRFVLQKGVFPSRPGVLRRCDGLARVCRRPGIWGVQAVTTPGDPVVTYPEVPRPLYVYAVEGRNEEERLELASWVENQIEVEVS